MENSITITESNKVPNTTALKLPKITNFQSLFSSPRTQRTKPLSLRRQKSISPIRTYKKPRFNNDLTTVKNLNFEIEVDKNFDEQLKVERRREKINENTEIKEKRLGIYKKKEEEDKELAKDKEKENNISVSIEKLDSKEKEKLVEKKYKDSLHKLEKEEKEAEDLNKEINKKMEEIDDFKLEINVIENYGEEHDRKKLSEEMNKDKDKEKEKKEENESIFKRISGNYVSPNKKKRLNSPHKKNINEERFDNYNMYMRLKQQRADRIQKLKEKIIENKNLIKDLKEKQEILEKSIEETKKMIYIYRKRLVDIYHLKLYEGLDFKGDGLTSIIRAIWNLGVNVDINFMPPYLDMESINYLFTRARQLIDVGKMRQIIQESEKDFVYSLSQWKNENTNSKENSFNKDKIFKTRINEEKYAHLNDYPNTKKFMKLYGKKFSSDREGEEQLKFNQSLYRSLNIPLKIYDKNKKVETMKYLLQTLLDQMEKNEINEIERIFKEFSKNEYQKKYDVCIEVVLAALCGEERKDERLNLVAKLQKEHKDNVKLIEYYSNFNKPVKK